MSVPLKYGIFRAQRKMSAVHIGQQEVVVGNHFSCFLSENDGSSSVCFTAAIATPLKGPASRMRRGSESEPFLFHLRG